MDQWGKVFVEAGRRFGRPFDVVGDNCVDDAFKEAGFEDINTWNFKVGVRSLVARRMRSAKLTPGW